MRFCCTLLIFLFTIQTSLRAQRILSVDIKAEKPDIAQLYFDVGSGLSEANSTRAKLIGDGDYEQIQFSIPDGDIKMLRLDPLTKPGFVLIRSMHIKYGDSLFYLPLKEVSPSGQILKSEYRDSMLYVETTLDGFDPQLMLPIQNIKFKGKSQKHSGIQPWVIFSLWVAMVMMFFAVLFRCFTGTKREIFILAGVFFSIFSSKLFLIAQYGSFVPFWDQWDDEGFQILLPFLHDSLDWSHLVRAHNEHRILLTRLFVLGFFVLHGVWDSILSMVAQAILHAGVLVLLLSVSRSFLRKQAWGVFSVIIVLLYMVPFSFENTLWGFQSPFFLAMFCGLVGIHLTWKHIPLTRGWFAGWGSLVLGLFAMGSGFLAAAAILGVGMVSVWNQDKKSRRRDVVSLAFIAIVIIAGIFLHVNVPRHESLKATGIRDFMDFFIRLATWPTTQPFWSLILHFPVVVLVFWLLIRRPPRTDPAWLLATLCCWTVLNMAALAYGRANSGLASRYTDGLALGLLHSLAVILFFCRLPQVIPRRIAQVGLGVFVTVLMAGALSLMTKDLIISIPAKKALEPIQTKYLLSFMTTDQESVLEDKPRLHIPYPNARRLAMMLRRDRLREILPAGLNCGLVPESFRRNDSVFLTNGGTPQSTTPVNLYPYFGSYTSAGVESTGKLRLDFLSFPSVDRFEMSIAGYPLANGMQLFVETKDGDIIPISIDSDPKEVWKKVNVNNPGKPFSIVAVDGSASSWLAFGLPTPIGRLSHLIQWLLTYWWVFGAVGSACFSLSAMMHEWEDALVSRNEKSSHPPHEKK
jgi:hypothetical protein